MRTAQQVYQDYAGRRLGIIAALVRECVVALLLPKPGPTSPGPELKKHALPCSFSKFYQDCDPEKVFPAAGKVTHARSDSCPLPACRTTLCSSPSQVRALPRPLLKQLS